MINPVKSFLTHGPLNECNEAHLTFESVKKIQCCDHSNETILAVLLHSASYFSAFYRVKLENIVES